MQLTKQKAISPETKSSKKVDSGTRVDAAMEEGLLEGGEVSNADGEETILIDPKKSRSTSYSTFASPQGTQEGANS